MMRRREDLEEELRLWKELAKLQDKLLAAYRAHKQPAGSVLDRITLVRDKLRPYIEAALLREKVS